MYQNQFTNPRTPYLLNGLIFFIIGELGYAIGTLCRFLSNIFDTEISVFQEFIQGFRAGIEGKEYQPLDRLPNPSDPNLEIVV